MAQPEEQQGIVGTCHCGAVTIRLSHAPEAVTQCNCSVCRRYGTLWAYYPKSAVTIETTTPTDTYAWNGKHIDFNRCSTCGCVTHWYPRDESRGSFGINARLLDPALLDKATIRQVDSAGTGIFH